MAIKKKAPKKAPIKTSSDDRPKKGKNESVFVIGIFVIVVLAALAGSAATYKLVENSADSRLSQLRNDLSSQVQDLKAKLSAEKELLNKEIKNADQLRQVMEEALKNRKKKAIFGDQVTVSLDVPESWSLYSDTENIGKNNISSIPTASIAQGQIYHGSFNARQIDIYFVENDVLETLTDGKEENPDVWLKESVLGTDVDVKVILNEEGETPTTGKEYYIPVPDEARGEDGFHLLIIKKQSAGEADFETAFSEMISSLKFNPAIANEEPQT